MPKATKPTTEKSAPKTAKTEVKRSAPIDEFLAGTADTRPSFSETMCELSTGIDLLIDRINYAIDTASDLGDDYGNDGWYTLYAIKETRWIAQRVGEEVTKVGRDFNGIRSDRAQAAE